jgi:very-short-patch-repair endonuclease
MQCGKEYNVRPSWGQSRFCSRECWYAFQRENIDNRITKSCEFCGKEFKVYPNRKEKARFCSHQCYSKSLKARYEDCIRICDFCGEKFLVSFPLKKKRFCSITCKNKWVAKNRNPNWRLGVINGHKKRSYESYENGMRVLQKWVKKNGAWNKGREMPEKTIIKMVKEKIKHQLKFDNYSSLEDIMRKYLVDAGRVFLHNERIGRYVVDFLLPLEYHIIEVDGYFHKYDDDEKTKKRDWFLMEKGYTVEHVIEEELKQYV